MWLEEKQRLMGEHSFGAKFSAAVASHDLIGCRPADGLGLAVLDVSEAYIIPKVV